MLLKGVHFLSRVQIWSFDWSDLRILIMSLIIPVGLVLLINNYNEAVTKMVVCSDRNRAPTSR